MANFEFNNFVKGFVSDANPLTFPEGTSKDEDNFKLNIDGSRQRRLGLNFDSSPVIQVPEVGFRSSYLWENVNSSGVSLYIVQSGLLLNFHRVGAEGIGEKIAEVDVTGVTTGILNDPFSYRLNFTSGFGRLFVAGQHIDPFWIKFNIDLQDFEFGIIDIQIRDFEGVDDGLRPDERPTNLTPEHQYNLINQGWGNIVTYKKSVQVTIPVIGVFRIFRAVTRTVVTDVTAPIYQQYKDAQGVFPSNSQIWTIGKDSEDNFNPKLLDKMDFGLSLAPKGKNIFDPFNQERRLQDETMLAGHPVVESTRPDTLAFFQGRVFYAGITAENSKSNLTTGHVFFSQIVTDIERAGRCYQEADPTSEHISDIIADDGGVIILSGCARVRSMVPIAGSLMVIADNGVWEISGNEAGFSALDYRVRKLTEIGTISQEYVTYEGSLFYLSEADWMVVTYSNEAGGFVVNSLTENVVSRYYRSIPFACRRAAKLRFDNSSKTAIMMFSMNENSCENKTNLLMYDFNLQAWYKYSFLPLEGDFLIDLAYVSDSLSTFSDDIVMVEDEQVFVGNELVVSRRVLPETASPELRFLVCSCDTYRFAYMFDESFKDFGVNAYKSFLVTGVNTFGDTMRNKQVEYIITSLKRTEQIEVDQIVKESSCFMSTRWDFSDESISGKWSKPQQVYRYKRFFIPQGQSLGYGHEVLQTKNKVRGTGKALSFVFESEEGKDLHLYGWAVTMSGRRGV